MACTCNSGILAGSKCTANITITSVCNVGPILDMPPGYRGVLYHKKWCYSSQIYKELSFVSVWQFHPKWPESSNNGWYCTGATFIQKRMTRIIQKMDKVSHSIEKDTLKSSKNEWKTTQSFRNGWLYVGYFHPYLESDYTRCSSKNRTEQVRATADTLRVDVDHKTVCTWSISITP